MQGRQTRALEGSDGVQEERTRSQQGKTSGEFQGRQTRALQRSDGVQEGTDSLAAGKETLERRRK